MALKSSGLACEQPSSLHRAGQVFESCFRRATVNLRSSDRNGRFRAMIGWAPRHPATFPTPEDVPTLSHSI
jgi:hypothetical protein